MHNRVLSWLFFCAFAAVSFTQTPAPAGAPASALPLPGFVLVAKVDGEVWKTVNGQRSQLKVNDQVEQSARVNTQVASSIVLAFSNGATTQLGEDTELIIEEFLQDPFGATIQVANLDEEPSRSNTKLRLNKGELIGKVAKLKRDRGSTFVVETPVGAAGIRGTTFRIVFRPQGTGLAFFSLSTVEGDVNFTPPGQPTQTVSGIGTPADPAAPATPASPATTPPTLSGGSGGVSVTGGQEVIITVSVTTAPTGQMIVATPPTITSSVPINTQTQNQIVQQAQQIATAVATTSFTSPPPAPSAAGSGTRTSTTAPESTATPAPTTPGTDTPGTGATTGITGSVTGTTGTPSGTASTGSASTSSSSIAGQSGTTPATPATPTQTPATPATPNRPPLNTPPPAAQPPPRVTTGDGLPGT